VLLPSSCTSRGLSGRFAEKVARDIEDRKPPPLFRMRLEVCLNEYLHRLLTGVHFDPERRIAEINLVAATVHSSDNRMRHDLLPPFDAITQDVSQHIIGHRERMPTAIRIMAGNRSKV
jgi:hypothetical protein